MLLILLRKKSRLDIGKIEKEGDVGGFKLVRKCGN